MGAVLIMFGWVDKKTFEEHTKNDKKQFKRGQKEFKAVRVALNSHDVRVDSFHEQNTAMIVGVQSQVKAVQMSVEELLKLKPDIEAGVKADQERLQRRIRWRTAFTTGISVLLVISGLIPLFLWLSSLKIVVHQG